MVLAYLASGPGGGVVGVNKTMEKIEGEETGEQSGNKGKKLVVVSSTKDRRGSSSALAALAALALAALLGGAPTAEAASVGTLRSKFEDLYDEAASGPSHASGAAAVSDELNTLAATPSAGDRRDAEAVDEDEAEADELGWRPERRKLGTCSCVGGLVYLSRLYDLDDPSNYYLDPSETSYLKRLSVGLKDQTPRDGVDQDVKHNLYVDEDVEIKNELWVDSGKVRVVTDEPRPQTDKETGIFWGTGSNKDGDDKAYAIYREGGEWVHPYPDLRIAFNTGIKIGAGPDGGEGGVRFYSHAFMDDLKTKTRSYGELLFSVGVGDHNVQVENDFIVNSLDSDGNTSPGSDSAYACLDGAGKLFRSQTPCVVSTRTATCVVQERTARGGRGPLGPVLICAEPP